MTRRDGISLRNPLTTVGQPQIFAGTSKIDITVRPTELSKKIRNSAKSLIEELEQLADLDVEKSIADDDPYRTPQKIGDAAMSKSVGPIEREAAQALVQSASCSHG